MYSEIQSTFKIKKKISSLQIALRLWLSASIILSVGVTIYFSWPEPSGAIYILFVCLIIATVSSLPFFAALLVAMPLIIKIFSLYTIRLIILLLLFIVISCLYGGGTGLLVDFPIGEYSSWQSFFTTVVECSGSVLSAVIVAFFINLKYINNYFLLNIENKINMHEQSQTITNKSGTSQANKIWLKGLVTGGLILAMLIPTVFVSNLVEERQLRQQAVKNEVSSKWAGAQSITFPYLNIPYTETTTLANGKISVENKSFIVLPDNLEVTGSVSTEQRQRSIYSVLLYNSALNSKGNFNVEIPEGIDTSTIDWANAKLCVGISDFKGIEQKFTANFNNVNYDFSAGLPTHEIDSTGLSASINLTAADIGKSLPFSLPLKIKGSDQLHFAPLAGNSKFNLTSNWNSPSFDGNTIPSERNLNNNGFEANWSFNKANLPFNTSFKNFNFKKDDYAFGITLLQPTDQYAKTLRCVKYAILFIGLTFSFFFIIEIMQRKPFHPVQYVLVGLALIIFYTLLLSISEFLQFNFSYLIAAVATVLLITLYAKGHFKSWKVAISFAGVIGSVYGFIYVLISLEDTALLIGSIGLFVILAIAMYASRKVNWYGNSLNENVAI